MMINSSVNLSRRRSLKAGVAAAALFAPASFAWVWAQSEGAMKLLRLPKLALVIGNGGYRSAPALNNPGNDAKAISEVLRQCGFDVNVRLDAGLDEMSAAIRGYLQALAVKRAVGLLYFAGHGLQLNWRNYLVPVDAAVRDVDDIARTCVDLTSVMDGINKAANPMNVVILDACRDNPFGAVTRAPGRGLVPAQTTEGKPLLGAATRGAAAESRGLSQMDAPHGTLLAYATAPGNVASDGEGENGLYTENLLREIRVPEAKVEDVFKRVRLNVRRRTGGRQIPWESTSLEEDFWFVPPKELTRISEAEAARAFEVELALWEKIKAAKEPGPLEEYLRLYPGGRFSELAQFQLDRVLAAQGEKKIEIAPQENNPYTKGTARARGNFQIGDRYTGRRFDLLTRLEGRGTVLTVTAITDTEVFFNKGNLITDLLGNVRRAPNGHTSTGHQRFIAEYSVGKRWVTRFRGMRPDGEPDEWTMNYRVAGAETVTVPAGTFDAYRVEGHGYMHGGGVSYTSKYWIAPGKVRRPIAAEEANRLRNGQLLNNDRFELVAFRES